MGIPLERKERTERDNLLENGSNRLAGDTSGEGQWVMVSLLPPPTHEGWTLSCWPGNRARRTASSSVGPVGRESGSADCCHLDTTEQWSTSELQRHLLLVSLGRRRSARVDVCACLDCVSPWFFNGKGIVSLSLLRRFFISLMSLRRVEASLGLLCSVGQYSLPLKVVHWWH